MIVAHLGPPLARTGGPAGYLWQLRDALAGVSSRHRVLFPDEAGVTPAHFGAAPSLVQRIRRRARRLLTGAPRFYRPPASDLRRRGGAIDRAVREVIRETAAAAEPSLARAQHERADVLFAHDLGTALAALDARAAGQQVWLMLHAPMSLALYLAWNWGVPEQRAEEVVTYPDVRFWSEYELETCTRVDRLVLPCREVVDDLARSDHRFAAVLDRAEIVPTGASRAGGRDPARAARAAWDLPEDRRVGLFLGTQQAYRGFDALVAGVSQVGGLDAIPGVVAVAGPEPSTVPLHPRLRALGRVDDVSALLSTVDFVINVNRFSLFDLSLIEALEAGCPLLLHDSGGNRAFRALGAGCLPLADLEPATVSEGLARFFTMRDEKLTALGDRSRACYETHLTPRHFAVRHLALYDRCEAQPLVGATA